MLEDNGLGQMNIEVESNVDQNSNLSETNNFGNFDAPLNDEANQNE